VATETVLVPDLGGAESVDVIEVCVAVGDVLELEQSIVVLETDKASMEIPSPFAGKVVAMHVNEGDSLSEGAALLDLEIEGAQASSEADAELKTDVEVKPETNPEPIVETTPAVVGNNSLSAETVLTTPDVGGDDAVEVIEICVSIGDVLSEGDSIVVLESDKASMEIPAKSAGEVVSISVVEGDKVVTGDALIVIKGDAPVAAIAEAPPAVTQVPIAQSSPTQTPTVQSVPQTQQKPTDSDSSISSAEAYAGPAVRKLARQLGVDLGRVKSTGPKNRLTREDIRTYVQNVVAQVEGGQLQSGSGIPPIPAVDFAKFGEIETVKLSKIGKLTVKSMSRSWLNVPHVTQFDEADITELESFRKSMKAESEKRGVRLTPLPFLIKAAAAALLQEPSFNVSLHNDGEHIVHKKYVNIGIAVDTPNGLLVPVIKNADKKGLLELAAETLELAEKARKGKLLPGDMQGGCFTISSLGAIGGNGFTPIVNAPEVAIMGVSKAQIKPIWNGSEFLPRQMLPLTVSYDHRAINGADCGRFFTCLVALLSDIRRFAL
jgi:pyruvate dehydrogenase E2 component (dihydrolipoamide acetyltransferase)